MSKKELKKLAQSWREYADGHYCQTYNNGMGDGLRKAADELEAALKKPSAHSAPNKVSPRKSFFLIETTVVAEQGARSCPVAGDDCNDPACPYCN